MTATFRMSFRFMSPDRDGESCWLPDVIQSQLMAGSVNISTFTVGVPQHDRKAARCRCDEGKRGFGLWRVNSMSIAGRYYRCGRAMLPLRASRSQNEGGTVQDARLGPGDSLGALRGRLAPGVHGA